MNEYLYLAIVFLTGWSILNAAGLRGWGTVPAGFATGAFALVACGLLLLVSGLPPSGFWLMGAMGLIAVACILPSIAGLAVRDLAMIAIGLVLVGAAVLLFHKYSLAKYHIDSFRYLLAGRLLALDRFDIAGGNILMKRMLAVPLLHSPAHLFGEFYVRTITPLLSFSLLGCMVWYLAKGGRPAAGRLHFIFTALVMVLLLATNSRYVFQTFYINGHLFFGLAFLVVVASSWLLATRPDLDRRPLNVMIALALPAIVVTRPEGFLVAGLALLPMQLSDAVSLKARRYQLLVYGVSVILWYAYVAGDYYFGHVKSPRLPTLGALALGCGIAFTAIVMPRMPGLLRWLSDRQRVLLICVEIVLWLALAAFTVREPGVMERSLDATYQNVAMGYGSWGSSFIMLAALLLGAWVFCRDASLIYLRFPVTTMIPFFFLLAYVREGAYRVGNGDSLNRMWMEFIPLAVLFMAAAVLSARWGLPWHWRSGREDGGVLKLKPDRLGESLPDTGGA